MTIMTYDLLFISKSSQISSSVTRMENVTTKSRKKTSFDQLLHIIQSYVLFFLYRDV